MSGSSSISVIYLLIYLESWFLTERGVWQLPRLSDQWSLWIHLYLWPPVLGLHSYATLLSFYVGPGNLNSGPRACEAGAELPPQPTFPFFAIIWVMHRGTCHRTMSREINVGTKEHILSIDTFGKQFSVRVPMPHHPAIPLPSAHTQTCSCAQGNVSKRCQRSIVCDFF